VFILACAFLNTVCLVLSVPALIWVSVYSLSKRFTWLCHFILGSVLGLAPIAGWIAFDPVWHPAYICLFLGVLFRVAGFDILYAAQDTEFDQEVGLHSLPADFGLETAFALSGFCHVNAALFLGLAGVLAGAGAWYFIAWGITTHSFIGALYNFPERSFPDKRGFFHPERSGFPAPSGRSGRGYNFLISGG